MGKLSIIGNGPLKGDVAIPGAKNAALPALAAGLLTEEPLHISRLPDMIDISTMLALLRQLGANVEVDGSDVRLAHSGLNYSPRAPSEQVQALRASILVLGPLLARFGVAELALPGGCDIGSRPVDLHIEGLQAMGAEICIEDGFIKATAGHLRGADIRLYTASVTATENLMMAATLADGRTTIHNAAREPEVLDLANCLNAMGARVFGAGTDTILIDGVARLKAASHGIIPDRIETGTYLVAAAATRGKITVHNTTPGFLGAILERLYKIGAVVLTGEDWVKLDMKGHRPQAVDVVTGPYPVFPTDMQAQFVALNAVASGHATVTETVFENRFRHVRELQRMGACIMQNERSLSIQGTERLRGAEVTATDLRASASLVIAALCAEGETVIDQIHHLDRGYAQLDHQLRQLGAIISRDPGGLAECDMFEGLSQATAGAQA